MNPPSRFLPLLLALGVFMQMLDATVLNTALPAIAADLQESPLNMQSVVIAYALTLALMTPLSGVLADRFGTRRLYIAALAVFVAGSALCAAASQLNMLVLARVIQGMGGAMLTPVARLITLRAYARSDLVRVTNYIVMPALLGPVLGPVLGGYLVDYASWHWIFLINIPIGLIGIWGARRLLPDLRQRGTPFDLSGFLLFGGGALGLSMAFEWVLYPHARLFSVLVGAGGVLLLWGYWHHARHSRDPLYAPDLLSVRTFRIGLAGGLASRLGMSALPFLLPLLLQVAFGYSATRAGWLLAPVALSSIAVKPLLPRLIRRFGYRCLLVNNTRCVGLLIMSLALLQADTPLWLLVLLMLLLGMVNSIQFSGMNTLTVADLRSRQASSGSSLMGVNQQLAISLGIAVSALLLQGFSQAAWAGGDVRYAFAATFVAVGLFTLASAQIFARLHRLDGNSLIERK
ncbi:EmrB/QacA subfamily drug resistance transporter [Neisseria sp. HSC-16F19]|nr:MFS transporter [Neisseria sp. HSC-16F19]MCP2040314.1 EmrB/QacA subfamily drug resistance transporter [Neisseria sp. HSC-16F19]